MKIAGRSLKIKRIKIKEELQFSAAYNCLVQPDELEARLEAQSENDTSKFSMGTVPLEDWGGGVLLKRL